MELINQIDETFKFENKEIRVLGSYNEPWFVAKDICNILELSNITEALRNIPQKWKSSEILNTSTRGNQTMIMLSEPAVYNFIMRSNKPIAKKFQEAVCEQILPSLRKKGEYQIESIMNKNKELSIELEKKDEKIKKLQRETQVVDGHNVCYLCTTDEKEKEGIFTVGKAVNLKNKLFNFKMVYYISCKSVQLMDAIEKIILSKLNRYKIVSTRDVFQLPEGKDVSFFMQPFEYLKKFCDDIEEDLVIEEELKDEIFEEKDKKKEYMKIYREENDEHISASKKKYNQERKEIMEERINCVCGSIVTRQNMTAHLDTNRHKKFVETGKTMDESRKEDYIICKCGMSISKRGIKRHEGSKVHKSYLEAHDVNEDK
jgi:prophage antirepressor-like protein